MLPKAVRSYALDALTASEGESAPTVEAAKGFLADVAESQVQSFPIATVPTATTEAR